MLSRIRFTAGVFALFALFLPVAGAAAAFACAPGMEMAVNAQSGAAERSPAGGGSHAADPGIGSDSAHTPEPGTPTSERCPLMPMAASSCAATASLPSHAGIEVPTLFENAVLLPAYETAPEVLLGKVLFHPPKL